MNTHFSLSPEELRTAVQKLDALASAMNQVLFGKEDLIELILTGVLARGHILLEGLPGLGKTELVKGLSKALDITARRVQFTPDLLPGDITGTPVLQETDGRKSFVFQEGPVFANIMLADEINRASPKTQSALLEAMQERKVTVMGQSHSLPEPFFVLATQNPIELEGTYPLPEAQLDRFMFLIEVDYPTEDEEMRIARETTGNRSEELKHTVIMLSLDCITKEDIPSAMHGGSRLSPFRRLLPLRRRTVFLPQRKAITHAQERPWESTVASTAPCTPSFKAKRKIGSRTMLATAPIRTVVMPILAKPRPVMKAFGPRMSCTKTVPIAQRRMSSPFR